jgi:uncharacterized alkaline shock family protein YloU
MEPRRSTEAPAPKRKGAPEQPADGPATPPERPLPDRVHVSDAAVATIVGLAAHEVPGVVGMAPASLGEGLRRVLGLQQVDEGVEVSHVPASDTVEIHLHVVMAYGVNIPAVAESVRERVTYAAATFAGVKPAQIVVHVAGVSRA